MTKRKFKVVILTHGGAGPLIASLSQLDDVVIKGIFIEKQHTRKRPLLEKLKRSVKYDGTFETVKKLASALIKKGGPGSAQSVAIDQAQQQLVVQAEKSGHPIFWVADYHSDTCISLLKEADADLGIIYGTNIIKESVFSIPSMGSMNLHQGLAPYYRGGPTVFWELYNNEDVVGITVHFVAPKVDTGDIVLQKKIEMSYDFNKYGLNFEGFLSDFRASLTIPSVELMTEAVRQISTGSYTRVPQDISLGKRYRIPTKREKNELHRRLKHRSKIS